MTDQSEPLEIGGPGPRPRPRTGRIYEQMVKVYCSPWTIRAWLNAPEDPSQELLRSQAEELRAAIFSAGPLTASNSFALCMAVADAVNCVSAIEVLNSDGQGACLYENWP